MYMTPIIIIICYIKIYYLSLILRCLFKGMFFGELWNFSLFLYPPSVTERQEEIIPEHPNNSNIRCSPQDKRCIQKTLARHPPKSANQRSNTAREETKAVLVREEHTLYIFLTENCYY